MICSVLLKGRSWSEFGLFFYNFWFTNKEFLTLRILTALKIAAGCFVVSLFAAIFLVKAAVHLYIQHFLLHSLIFLGRYTKLFVEFLGLLFSLVSLALWEFVEEANRDVVTIHWILLISLVKQQKVLILPNLRRKLILHDVILQDRKHLGALIPYLLSWIIYLKNWPGHPIHLQSTILVHDILLQSLDVVVAWVIRMLTYNL